MKFRDVDPLSAEYERPAPWVLSVASRGSLMQKTNVFADFKDQGCEANWVIKPANQLELFGLAAEKIRGAGVFTSSDSTYVGEETARLNTERLINREPFEATEVAVVVTGATEEQFTEAYREILEASEALATIAALHETDSLVNYRPCSAPPLTASEFETALFMAYIQDTNSQ